jgi:hypothetical protein
MRPRCGRSDGKSPSRVESTRSELPNGRPLPASSGERPLVGPRSIGPPARLELSSERSKNLSINIEPVLFHVTSRVERSFLNVENNRGEGSKCEGYLSKERGLRSLQLFGKNIVSET